MTIDEKVRLMVLREREFGPALEAREARIAAAKERIVGLARVWATGFSAGSFNLIDAVRELEEAEK